jgi:hypothetical protein
VSLPKWLLECRNAPEMDHLADRHRLIEAMVIAWSAMETADHWQNVKGLSAEGALAQVHIDLKTAMRRIEELGK